jgi:hypothetical protein
MNNELTYGDAIKLSELEANVKSSLKEVDTKLHAKLFPTKKSTVTARKALPIMKLVMSNKASEELCESMQKLADFKMELHRRGIEIR